MRPPVERVVLLDTQSRRPTFHALDGYQRGGGEFGGGALVTACGLPWTHYKKGVPLHGYAAVLRRDHVELFARPCKRCFG